eukprot:scaffold30123_cov41-Prasinocladus_malaysianus.AAC.2
MARLISTGLFLRRKWAACWGKDDRSTITQFNGKSAPSRVSPLCTGTKNASRPPNRRYLLGITNLNHAWPLVSSVVLV